MNNWNNISVFIHSDTLWWGREALGERMKNNPHAGFHFAWKAAKSFETFPYGSLLRIADRLFLFFSTWKQINLLPCARPCWFWKSKYRQARGWSDDVIGRYKSLLLFRLSHLLMPSAQNRRQIRGNLVPGCASHPFTDPSVAQNITCSH